MQAILHALDAAWGVYETITGRDPTPLSGTTLNGLDIVAEVPDGSTCGAACSYLGATGTQIATTYFNILYNGVLKNNQHDQILFYEFGRNFWFYSDQLGKIDAFITGFAIANRFISIDRIGVVGGPFNTLSYADFESSTTVDLLRIYLTNAAYTWQNTIATNQAPPNPNNWDAAALAGSMIYRIYADLGMNAYVAFWQALSMQPTATVQSSTIQNFIAAGKLATGVDYTFLFKTTPLQPMLALSRKSLNFASSGSFITGTQPVALTFANGSGIGWTASSNQSNIAVSLASGAGNGVLQIGAGSGPSGVVTVKAPGAANSPQQIQVNVASATPGLPFGSFDTPVNNTPNVAGAIPVTGWALDNIEVAGVDILREPVSGEPQGNLILIGSGVFVADARPDVQNMFPAYPYQYRAGWGYQLLTNFLPNASGSGPPGNGTYKLHAIAFGKSGYQQDLGTRTIMVDNAHAAKPFGTIDTPAQGGAIAGSDSVNFGWALTPQPAMIPTDGSTITVVIDGVPAAHPVYNQFRSDIASLFPVYANSMGAVGFYHINTTSLANGVHTISWNVFDNLGRGEGLGSRYFNVLNTGGGGSVAAPEDPIGESVARATDADGGDSVTMEEVGRIELHLGAARGNMLVEGKAQALPIGSTLKGGVFYWQPGPGFLGDYTLQFERPDGTTIPVRVSIVPKRY